MEEKKPKKKWGKWVFLALILFTLIGGAQEALTGSVSSTEDGEKVVEEIFPPEDGYHIRFDQKVDGWEGYFDVGVGEACDYAYKGDRIGVYVYYVVSDGGGDVFFGVSETGKVLGWGSLIPGSQAWAQRRLK